MATLGHVVFYVRNLEQSLSFYRDVVGLELVGRIFDGRAAMLTGGATHHELLLIEVGNAPGPLAGRRIGLYHVGWKIGESLEELRQARDRILEKGHAIDGLSDHTVSQSIYLRDPDGNEIELFVDDPRADWKNSREWLQEPVKPPRLE
jgi:catechol 2,3-dioxygenase